MYILSGRVTVPDVITTNWTEMGRYGDEAVARDLKVHYMRYVTAAFPGISVEMHISGAPSPEMPK